MSTTLQSTQSDEPVYQIPALPTDLDTPAVVVDLDVFERNVERMSSHLADSGVRLRPHAKTHSSSAVAAYQLSHGAEGITVGTLRMAQALAASGVTDIFVAAPVWPTAAERSRLRALADAVDLSVAVDSVAAVDALADCVAGGAQLRVVIEVDSGERRSGVRPEEVVEIALAARRRGLRVMGAFTHGGHSYGRPGAAAEAADDEVRVLRRAGEALQAVGFEVETLSAGSTPTVRRSSRDPVTEQRPGTYVFNDRQQVHLGGAGVADLGLCVAATVTSTAVPGQVILNSGAKALSKDRAEWLDGFGVIPAYPDARIVRLFDFHAVVRFPEGADLPRLGETVAVIPNHVCPTVNLARELVLSRDGKQVGSWAIDARG